MSTERAGVTVIEMMVAVVCGLLLIHLSLQGLALGRRVSEDIGHRVDRIGALRLSRVTLRNELRAGVPERDWTALPPDSISLRAFRGLALPCPGAVDSSEVLVSYRGLRGPEPAKDSLLVLLDNGDWVTTSLARVTPSSEPCGGAVRDPELWRIDPPRPGIVLGRLFERGSYHVALGAIRYRSGLGGRQPLTTEILDGVSGFSVERDAVGIVLEGGDVSWTWQAWLAGRLNGG